MLNLTRKPLRAPGLTSGQRGTSDPYHEAATILLTPDGQYLGEIVILQVVADPWNPGQFQVHLGLDLPRSMGVVRADAAWRHASLPETLLTSLGERAHWFGGTAPQQAIEEPTCEPAPATVVSALPPRQTTGQTTVGQQADDPSASSARYVFRPDSLSGNPAGNPADSHVSSPAPRPSGRYTDRRWER